MESDGYYYQSSTPSYTHTNQSSSPLPLHLCFFLLTLFLFMGMSWYLSYESVMEIVADHLGILVILSPLVLLLALHWLSGGGDGAGRVPFLLWLPERDSFHRAGGSPWGVGLLLVLLLLMVSYHSSFQDRWFPLRSR